MNAYGRVSFICTWSSRNGRGGQTSLKMAPVLPITRQGQIARAGQQENRTRDPHDLCVSAVSDCWIYDRHGVCKTFNSLHQHSKAIIVFVRVRHSWQLVCVYVYVHCVQMSFWLCFSNMLQNFLCYTCKEYVEDLGKIPRHMLQVRKITALLHWFDQLCVNNHIFMVRI